MVQYKIDSTGNSRKEVDNDLSGKRKSLVGKVGEVEPSKTVYRAVYELKDRSNGPDLRSVELESKVSWDDLLLKADKLLNDSKLYNISFTAEQYFNLTQEQNSSLSPQRPTAGYEGYKQKYSSDLSKMLRYQ